MKVIITILNGIKRFVIGLCKDFADARKGIFFILFFGLGIPLTQWSIDTIYSSISNYAVNEYKSEVLANETDSQIEVEWESLSSSEQSVEVSEQDNISKNELNSEDKTDIEEQIQSEQKSLKNKFYIAIIVLSVYICLYARWFYKFIKVMRR